MTSTTSPGQNLTKALLNRAWSEQNLMHFAMAFSLHKPNWGSQALLTAQGLLSYLMFIGWDPQRVESAVPEWLDTMQGHLSPELLSLRITQIRELGELTSDPRPVQLEANATIDLDPEVVELLIRLINNGVTYRDLEHARSGMLQTHIAIGTSEERRQRILTLLEEHLEALQHITFRVYVAVVRRDQRKYHPDVLKARSLQYLEKLVGAADPFFHGSSSGRVPLSLSTYAPTTVVGVMKA